MLNDAFIILQEDPDLMPPPPVSSARITAVADKVIGILAAAGVDPEEIFKQYSKECLLWSLPPRLPRDQSTPLIPINTKIRRLSELNVLHNRLRELVRRNGVGPKAYIEIEESFGIQGCHPAVFTPTGPGEESANLFSLELVLGLEISGSVLDMQGGALMRLFPRKQVARNSLKVSENVSKLATPTWINQALRKPRGSIIYETFDIFDRTNMWVTKNLLDESGKVALEWLAWLKMCQSPDLTYYFEQALYNIEPIAPMRVEAGYAHIMYTMEILDYIRDLWLNSEASDFQAFRDFYDYLVPTYIDDNDFRRTFGTGMVLEKDYNPSIGKKIDSGLLAFSARFAATARRIENMRNGKHG